MFTTGAPLSVELGPGLIESIYDGIQRPLTKIREQAGDRIPRGVMVDALDHEKLWGFKPAAKVGDELDVLLEENSKICVGLLGMRAYEPQD